MAGATLADGQAVGTITNDDGGSGLPSMSVADLSIVEGNSGTSVAIFTVSLSSPATGPVTFDMATANGSATAGSDYVASTQTGNAIGTNDTIRTFSVTINGDAEVESNETFTVNITNVVGATLADGQATGTISNDDGGGGGGGTPTLSIGDVSVTEGNAFSKQATFTVKLSAASASAVTYNIATANGTAIAGTDYVAKSLLGQSIPAGTTSKIFTVGIKGETMVEPNETFTVNVSTVVGATLVDGQAVGTIVNDDAAALSVSRVETGGLFDDIEDRQGETVVSATAYATALLDNARTICARAGGPGVVGVDGVESLAVLQDLAETANALCPRQPHYGAVMKVGPGSEQLGFLVDAAADKAAPGWAVLTAEPLASPVRIAGAGSRAPVRPALAIRVLAPGAELRDALTIVLAGSAPMPGVTRTAQARDVAGRLRTRLAANPNERLVVLGGTAELARAMNVELVDVGCAGVADGSRTHPGQPGGDGGLSVSTCRRLDGAGLVLRVAGTDARALSRSRCQV